MSATVIFLMIIGICLIAASFIFLDKDAGAGADGKQVVMLNDYELDEKQLEKLQQSIREVVKDYSEQLVDETDQKLNQVAGQKMMEISELADQVLDEIQKSHKECVFLYDMLDDKSNQLKSYVSNSAEKLISISQQSLEQEKEEEAEERHTQKVSATKETDSQIEEHLVEQVKQKETIPASEEDMQGTQEVQERNRIILERYQKGENVMDIAKNLDMGVGEVQLILDLFQGEN